MLEEEADELARGLNENDQAKDLTAPLVSAEPEIASMVCVPYFFFNIFAVDALGHLYSAGFHHAHFPGVVCQQPDLRKPEIAQ